MMNNLVFKCNSLVSDIEILLYQAKEDRRTEKQKKKEAAQKFLEYVKLRYEFSNLTKNNNDNN